MAAMSLWLLTATNGWDRNCYGVADGFVIRAESEAQARLIAAMNGGDEQASHGGSPVGGWLDPANATCEVLQSEGTPGMILRDFAAS